MSAFGPELQVRLDVETTNPLNGSQGRTKGAMLGRAAKRAALRRQAWEQCCWQTSARHTDVIDLQAGRIEIVVTRIAPRELDQHDGLGAALKPIVDGVADFLQWKDNDKRLDWVLKQKKGRVRECAVEIMFRRALHYAGGHENA